MTETFSVTLPASSNWANVSEHLNCPSGQFAFFKFFYVAKRNGIQQTGEIDINDTGSHVQAEHEWTIVPSNSDPNIEFNVIHQNGKRVFLYRTTSGSHSTTFKFKIEFKFG